MIKNLKSVIIGLAIVCGLFGSGYFVALHRTSAKLDQALVESDKHKKEAEIAYHQYEALKPIVAQKDGEIATIKQAVARKDKKLTELEALVNHDPGGTIIPVDPLDQALADLANEQASQLVVLKKEIVAHEGLESALREQVKDLDKGYKEQTLRANLNEIALKASIAANKASYWKGVLHGALYGGGGALAYNKLSNK
jgi:hypothetical protein